jgi:hypothetical protein
VASDLIRLDRDDSRADLGVTGGSQIFRGAAIGLPMRVMAVFRNFRPGRPEGPEAGPTVGRLVDTGVRQSRLLVGDVRRH